MRLPEPLEDDKERPMREALCIPLYMDGQESELPLFSLDGILPAIQGFSVNTACRLISLVSTKPIYRNPILLQSLMTEQQLRLLLPLLKWPRSCPYELLVASLSCPWQQLLAGLFSTQETARDEWLTLIGETAVLLERAQVQGTWRKELKQLYNVLSELRAKLHPFGIGIVNCTWRTAYGLIALPTLPQEGEIRTDVAGLRCSARAVPSRH
jgi:hypothetical protein